MRLLCVFLVAGTLLGVLAMNVGPGTRLLARVVASFAQSYGIAVSIESARLAGLGRIVLNDVTLDSPGGLSGAVAVERAHLTFDLGALASGAPIYDVVSRVRLKGVQFAVESGGGAQGAGKGLNVRLDIDATLGEQSLAVQAFSLHAASVDGRLAAQMQGETEILWPDGSTIIGTAQGGATEVAVGGHVYRLDGLDATFTVAENGIEVSEFTARRGDAQVTGSGMVQADGSFDFALAAEDLVFETDLPFLADYGFAGPAAFVGRLEGENGQWRLAGESSVGPGTLWGRPNVTGTGHLVWTQDGLSFTNIRLHQYGGEYVLDGEWQFATVQDPGRLDLALNTRSGRLSELLAVMNLPLPAAGRLYGDIRFFGPLNDLTAEGDVELVEAVLWEQPFDRVAGAFAWDGGRVSLEGVEASLGTGAAWVDGQVDAASGRLQLAFSATDWPLGFTQRFDAELGHLIGGIIDIPTGRLEGTLQAPELTAELAAEALRVGPALFRSVGGGLVYREHRLELRNLHGQRAGGGQYALSGAIDLVHPGRPGADLELQVDGERLGSLLQLAGEQLPAALIDGAVSGTINVSGPFADPEAKLDLLLQEAFALSRGLRVGMEYSGGALRVTDLELPKV